MDISLNKCWELVKVREAWSTAGHGVTESDMTCRLKSNSLFSYFCLLWVFIAVRGFLCCVRDSHCGGFPCCRAQALGMWASVAAVCGFSGCSLRALEIGLSSCGARA